MKKRLFALATLLILTGCRIQGLDNEQNDPIVTGEQDKVEAPAQTPVQTPAQTPVEVGFSIHVKKEQIHEGNLLLVNRVHAVPPEQGGEPAVNLFEHKELTKGFGLLDDSVRLSPDMTQKFTEMVSAAAKDGVDHFLISSGYRDEDEQNELYEQMGAERAMPAGHSEHNLGLSLDIGSSLTEMNQAPEGKWLADNAWKFGFVLRYPKDKTAVTGIMYEPWHFRYVGLPHSAVMQEKNLTLEQYLADLKKHSILTKFGGQTYEIFYFPISENENIRVPVSGSYEISGNNEDGVIVTVDTGPEGEDRP
ncbi:M15 family metallopeptidase [Cohnella yongneupensis]|uniref:D-alanyl-D-alanine carboxypeptidase family protein n=1 Tax=Cohnella yongneupensis TaxID=425006 RepID=A0ABW0QTS6_9BACL